MLGLCTIIMLVELRAKEGDTGEIGDVASRLLGQNTRFSSAEVCTIGRRMQCLGTSTSSSMRGQKRARRGLSAMSDAQMMPMLTSMADHVIAWMPESGFGLVLFYRVVGMFGWNLPTSLPLLSRRKTVASLTMLTTQTKNPSRNMSTRQIFCLRGRRSCVIAGSGSSRTVKSMPMLIPAADSQYFRGSMHSPDNCGFHSFATGVHKKVPANTLQQTAGIKSIKSA
jgi:hypothetical protein